MKKFLMFLAFALIVAGCGGSKSPQKVGQNATGDDILHLSVQKALNSALAKEKLDGSVKFVFGTGTKANIVKKGLISNKRTNAVGKDDEVACERAFISALIAFQDSVKKEGGSKAVNLVSFFRKSEFNSKVEYECAVGNLMVAVTLKGDVAK